jgi:hypothetical protein
VLVCNAEMRIVARRNFTSLSAGRVSIWFHCMAHRSSCFILFSVCFFVHFSLSLIMSEYNYLVNKMRDNYRNFFLDGQLNLFEIIDQSSGILQDQTLDCNFLAYLLDHNLDFLVTGEKQIELTPDQLIRYIGARMYYYNPALLSSQIFSLLTVTHFFDLSSPNGLLLNSGNRTILQLMDNSIQSAYDHTLYPVSGHTLGSLIHNTLNDVPFPCLSTPGALQRSDFSIGDILFPNNLLDPFTFVGFFTPGRSSASSFVFSLDDDSSSNLFAVYCYFSSRDLVVRVNAVVAGSPVLGQSFTFTNFPDREVLLSITSDGSNIYIRPSGYSAQSYALPDLSSLNPGLGHLFQSSWTSAEYAMEFYSALFSNEYCSQDNIAVLLSLFLTKYFFTIS